MGAAMTIKKSHRHIRLYLREHRGAEGVSASEMARKLGIARESVYRIERSQRRSAVWQARYGRALDITPAAFWTPPDQTWRFAQSA
jgi:DNA-binding XRE family transcriptional regulator